MSTPPLREGFTTGTAATAAGMAACTLLLTGEKLAQVRTPLPPFEEDGPQEKPAGYWQVPVAEVHGSGHSAWAAVIKDGGDDPDATHGARIEVEVRPVPAASPQKGGEIFIEGGQGVGRVTLPGLPVAVGEAAINPVPRRQIAYGVGQVARAQGYRGALHVLVRVPQGESMARHTFNPRLGIVGGISILGTQGTVKPYSHEAWRATIRQGLEVAVATGCRTLCLSTGRRSEKLLQALYPHLPAQAAVQVADFAEFSLQEAGKLPIDLLLWGCFFGKLVKLAQGHGYTHARDSELDFALLSQWFAEHGAPVDVRHCVTANHALDVLLHTEPQRAQSVLTGIARRAAQVAAAFAGRPQEHMRVHLFHLNGQELVRV